MKYLGIDYGKRKVGLSLSEGLTASPLKTIETSSLKDSVQKILQIIKNEQIEKVIIGLPESGEAKKLVESFIKEMSEALLRIKKEGVAVVTTDETLSSQNALTDMINLGLSKKSRKSEDAYSAALILQEYLDKE